MMNESMSCYYRGLYRQLKKGEFTNIYVDVPDSTFDYLEGVGGKAIDGLDLTMFTMIGTRAVMLAQATDDVTLNNGDLVMVIDNWWGKL